MSPAVVAPPTIKDLWKNQPSTAERYGGEEEEVESFVDEVMIEGFSDHSGSYYTHSDVEVEINDDEDVYSVSVSLPDDEGEEPMEKNEPTTQALTERLAAKREERETQQHRRNHGRSKISTGTKKYMAKYPDQSSDGILRLGNKVPDFACNTSVGPMESFHQFKHGKWAVLFSHPSDFTPVCTTEIAGLAARYPEFKKLNCVLIGLSIDSAESHRQWMQDIIAHYHVDDDVENCDLDVGFPIIADEDRKIAHMFGMIDVTNPENLTIRSVFIIDPDQKLRINLSYPASVGRNLDEIVRCVKSLQLSYQKSIATPADWPRNHPRVKLADGTISHDWKGSVFLLPTVSTEQALLNYPEFHACSVPSQKKYLRLVQAAHVGVDPADLPSDDMETKKHSISKTNSDTLQEATTEETGQWKWPWETSTKENEQSATDTEPATEQEESKWPWENWKWPWEGNEEHDPEVTI